MNADVSRACAQLKNHLQMGPGPQLDALIRGAESSDTLADLPNWIKAGIKKMGGEYAEKLTALAA